MDLGPVVAIAPYLEETAVFSRYDFTKYSDQSPNAELAATTVIATLVLAALLPEPAATPGEPLSRSMMR